MTRTVTVETYETGEGLPADRLVSTETVEEDDTAPSPDERIAALESRLDAVAALAEKANATATEVAEAAKPVR